MKNVLMVFMAVPFFVAYSDPFLEQGEVIRRYTNSAIGEVIEIKKSNGDRAVIFSETTNNPHRLTSEQTKRLYDASVFERKLPYQDKPFALLGSVGQQVKLCNLIVVGRATAVKRPEDVSDTEPIVVTISVETNVFGTAPRKKVQVRLSGWDAERAVYRKGDRFLVFLSMTNYTVNTFVNVGHFDFDISRKKGEAVTRPVVFYGGRAMIRLDNVETEREVLAAVNGYLACLRKGIRDADKYYSMLREFVRSPVERIREDARSDLRLIFYCPGIMEKVIADEKIDDDLKNYARYLLTRDRKKKTP